VRLVVDASVALESLLGTPLGAALGPRPLVRHGGDGRDVPREEYPAGVVPFGPAYPRKTFLLCQTRALTSGRSPSDRGSVIGLPISG